MLDNFRNQPNDTPFFHEEEAPPERPELKPKAAARPGGRTFDRVTGTTAFQRFVLAMMFFIMICLAGITLLVLTGKVVLSFLF